MKCSDCPFFCYRFMSIRIVGYCTEQGCIADPEDEGACDFEEGGDE